MRGVRIRIQPQEHIAFVFIIFNDFRQRFDGRVFGICIVHQNVDVLIIARGGVFDKLRNRDPVAARVGRIDVPIEILIALFLDFLGKRSHETIDIIGRDHIARTSRKTDHF